MWGTPRDDSIRRPPQALIGIYTVALPVLAFAATIAQGYANAYLTLAWILGAMFTILLAYEWRRVGHPITPAGILAFGGLLIFFLRPLTVETNGTTTAGAMAQTMLFQGPIVAAGGRALLQIVIFYWLLGVVYFYRVRLGRVPRARPIGTAEPPSDAALVHAATMLKASMVFALACCAILIQGAGGLTAYFSGIANRSSFLAGKYYFTLGYIPLGICLVLYVLVCRRRPDRPAWTPLTITAAVALLATAVTTGGRGPLILGAVIPLITLKQVGPNPLRSRTLATLTLLITAVALLMSLLLRTNTYNKGQSFQALKQRPVPTLLEQLTSGSETRPFDSLIMLNYEVMSGDLPLQHGSTYLRAPTWFVPGALLQSKEAGANTWFTKTYLPAFYYPDHVETSISAVGEAYANFSWLGLAIVGALTGAAAAMFTNRRRNDLRADLLFVTVTPIFFSFLRGDSYQNLSLATLTIVLALVAHRGFLTVKSRPVLDRPGPVRPSGHRWYDVVGEPSATSGVGEDVALRRLS